MTRPNILLIIIVAQQVLFTQFPRITAKYRQNKMLYFIDSVVMYMRLLG